MYTHFFPNMRLSQLIQTVAALISFITILSATFLIALKIILITQRSHMHYSYTKTVEIIIQSAAIVSIVLLGISILSLLDFIHIFSISTSGGKFAYQLGIYLVAAELSIAVCIS